MVGGKKVRLDRKIGLLRNMIIRSHIIKLILTLESNGPMTFGQLRDAGVKKMDRTTDLLAITRKHSDDNHIVKYELTSKGQRLSAALRELLDTLEEILPED